MTSHRASNLLYLILGALSVAIVAAVLVATGTFDRDSATPQATASPAASTTPASTSSAVDNVADLYERVSPGVVFISARSAQGAGTGSGFVVGTDGSIVTNDHVVEGAEEVSVRFTENGDPIDARVVGTDPSTDLALLDVDEDQVEGGVKPLELGESDDLRPGEPTVAIGSPFGLQGTVTTGIVSALGREIQAPNGFAISGVIQTDAAINPGNSGGPLLDGKGRVIGVNSQIATGGSGAGANTGVGFAVPIDTVKVVVPKLKADGEIERAFIGVTSSEAAPRDGALVQDVSGEPAQQAGIRPGDLIVKLGDRTIASPSDLGEAVLTHEPGDTVDVEVVRNGDRETLKVTLGTRPDEPIQG
jgi:putative serine protease PepD